MCNGVTLGGRFYFILREARGSAAASSICSANSFCFAFSSSRPSRRLPDTHTAVFGFPVIKCCVRNPHTCGTGRPPSCLPSCSFSPHNPLFRKSLLSSFVRPLLLNLIHSGGNFSGRSSHTNEEMYGSASKGEIDACRWSRADRISQQFDEYANEIQMRNDQFVDG